MTLRADQLQWLSQDLAEAASEVLDWGECIGASARSDMAIALVGEASSHWPAAYETVAAACTVEGIFGFVVTRHADIYEVRGAVTWDKASGQVVDIEGAAWSESPLWRGRVDGEVYVVTPGPRLRISALAKGIRSLSRLAYAL